MNATDRADERLLLHGKLYPATALGHPRRSIHGLLTQVAHRYSLWRLLL